MANRSANRGSVLLAGTEKRLTRSQQMKKKEQAWQAAKDKEAEEKAASKGLKKLSPATKGAFQAGK